jgi:hypothetical protein
VTRIRAALIGVVAALAIAIPFVAPASASTACNGGSSCDETLVTHNNAAQFILNSYNCISTVDHDVEKVVVFNNASDHQRHSFVVETRREIPSNSLVDTTTVFADYGASVTADMNVASESKSHHLYTYVRNGNGVEQRLSVWHAEGGDVWATADTLIYPYNTYSCS